jgi:hypothetical protein
LRVELHRAWSIGGSAATVLEQEREVCATVDDGCLAAPFEEVTRHGVVLLDVSTGRSRAGFVRVSVVGEWLEGQTSIEDFEERFGILGFELAGYDGVGFAIDATFAPSGSSGRLDVLGVTDPECHDPGCGGRQATVIGGGSWSGP